MESFSILVLIVYPFAAALSLGEVLSPRRGVQQNAVNKTP